MLSRNGLLTASRFTLCAENAITPRFSAANRLCFPCTSEVLSRSLVMARRSRRTYMFVKQVGDVVVGELLLSVIQTRHGLHHTLHKTVHGSCSERQLAITRATTVPELREPCTHIEGIAIPPSTEDVNVVVVAAVSQPRVQLCCRR